MPRFELRASVAAAFLLYCRSMHVDLGIWSKLTRLVVFLLFLAAVLAVVIWYLPLIKKNEAYRKEVLRLNEQVRLEEERARQLDAAIRAIRYDPQTVERLARERLTYARPGETVFYFQEPASSSGLHPLR